MMQIVTSNFITLIDLQSTYVKEHCDEMSDILDLVDQAAGSWHEQLPVAMYKTAKKLWQERKQRWNMSQVSRCCVI